jgi:structural maintenance of chromosome 2
VRSLFHSVKLNVNEPHFLIMQGNITKTINYKPQEILGLIEQASGTSLYNVKKQASIELIKKKNFKIEEYDRVLAEEVKPKFEELQRDKEIWEQFKAIEVQIDQKRKLQIAYNYSMLE